MDINTCTTILLALTTLNIGAILGAFRNKIIISTDKNNFHLFFYGFAIFVILTSMLCIIFYSKELFSPNWSGLIIVFTGIISSIILILFTKKHLVKKFIYSIEELNPIINNFTTNADKNNIRLFGGDLNFFGNSPNDMDNNSQYSYLKFLNFRKILILCEEPKDINTRLRYGKILSEIPIAELKYYHPQQADLRVRGRIKEVNGVVKLLMYTKINNGKYKAIETDTANSNGALYGNIWDLVWSLAIGPSSTQIQSCKDLFQKG
jgi:hypothetical protein